MQLYGRTQPLAHYPILECLSVIHRLGFDGVELCLENPDVAPSLLNDDLIARVRDHLVDLGLTSFSVSYHKDYIYDDAYFSDTIRGIEATPSFGSDIFVFSGAPPQKDDDDVWARVVGRTRDLVRAAEDNGVTLALEFEPGFVIGCTADLLRIFDEIDSPHLKANLDLGHVFLCDPDPMEAIHAVGEHIVHGHIENMARGVHDHLLPHEGDMSLGDYVRALDEVGFKGGLALDLYRQDYEAVAPEAIAFIRGLLPS
ncbi:MAG: sugar phosphate isomerase/epimerase family protein [Anaerolineae bacterium]